MPIEVYRKGASLAAKGATWEWNPRVTRSDFDDKYEKNPLIAERDYGANPPKSQQAALPDPDIIERLANKTRPSPVKEDGSFHEWFKGDPTLEYFIHIDMSRSHDATGIGIAHYDLIRDMVVMDLIHNLDPSKEWKLSFERVFIFVNALVALGFHFKKITFDSWQSYYMLERLINLGLPAEIYSVDSGTEAYDTLISTILMSKLDYYFQGRFVDELKHIKLYGGTKYDHDNNHSKDVSDGVAGSVTQCVKAHSGLALTDEEVNKAVHDTHFLDLQEFSLEDDATVWVITPREVPPIERTHKRVARIHATDDQLIFVLGWHDKENGRMLVEEFLIWENFTNDICVQRFENFINELTSMLNVTAFSTNDLVPVEIIGFLKNTGRNVSSPLSARTARRTHRRVAAVSPVSDATIRQMVSQLKKGNIAIPSEEKLIRDLKFMTASNQKERNYVCALATWSDFASREMTFGHSGSSMPRAIASGPAPVFTQNPAHGAQMTPAMMPKSQRSGSEMDGIRAKYRTYNPLPTPPRKGSSAGARALPRIIKG